MMAVILLYCLIVYVLDISKLVMICFYLRRLHHMIICCICIILYLMIWSIHIHYGPETEQKRCWRFKIVYLYLKSEFWSSLCKVFSVFLPCRAALPPWNGCLGFPIGQETFDFSKFGHLMPLFFKKVEKRRRHLLTSRDNICSCSCMICRRSLRSIVHADCSNVKCILLLNYVICRPFRLTFIYFIHVSLNGL